MKVFVAQTGALLFTLEGIRAEHFGFALAIGNSAADTLLGAHDLLVGVPRATVGAVAAAGQVRAFSLRDGSLVRTVSNPSPATDDLFGYAVASASFGTAGNRSFAVGAPNSGANGQGAVWVVSSGGSVITTIGGLGNAAGTGSTLACIGDVDGDVQPDYAVASFTNAHGHVRVHSGVDGRSLGHLFVGNPGFRLGGALCSAGDPTSEAYRFGLVVGVPGADRVQTTAMVETTFRRGPSPGIRPTSNARSGAAVAFVGDVDADGTQDFAIGAPGEIDNGIGRQGRATVFSGRDGATLWTVDGAGQHDGLGDAIAGPGDVNGDGVPDVAIGAKSADASGSLIDSGAVQIVSGANGAPIRTLFGGEAEEHFGAALAALGDVDGDGVGDLACGAPDFDGLVAVDRGRVRFVSGASGATLRTIAGSTNGETFGAALAATVDLDGDARSELLVGAPRADTATSDQGRVDLLSGATGARLLVIAGQDLSFARLGDGLAAGDVDGDCLQDLVVGAPGGGPGRVRALSRFGVPQGSSRFGIGCPGAGGFFPRIETFGGTPFSVGVPDFGISLSCAASNAPALLMVGFSDTDWRGVPLPFDATPVGFAGCSVLVSGDVLFSAATSGGGNGLGHAMVSMPIPADNSLTGVVLFVQWIVVDSRAPNGLGAMSPALRIVIQQVP
ncbi:MAG: FG-GAP repeat protein [Planctomycetes bacterium]|nr:FG-GAP repeat protein [Planctomycetota bacterium]